MNTKTIQSKIHRALSLALLPTALAFMSAASAQDIESITKNYAESMYQKFSEIRKGEIRFETKVVQAGNLKDVADYPLYSMILRPDFQIRLESKGTDQELKFSTPNSSELNTVMADTIRTITPDLTKTGGQYRLVEVTSHLGSDVTRHMTLELCSNVDNFCFLVDPTMAYLETAVYAFNESTTTANEVMLDSAANSTEAEENIGGYTKAATCSRGGGPNVSLQDLPFERGDQFTGGVRGTAEGFSANWSCSTQNNTCYVNVGASVPISNYTKFGNPLLNTWKAKCDKLDLKQANWRVGPTHYSRIVAITGCGVKRSGSLTFDYNYNGSGASLDYKLDFNGDNTYYRGGMYQRYCTK